MQSGVISCKMTYHLGVRGGETLCVDCDLKQGGRKGILFALGLIEDAG